MFPDKSLYSKLITYKKLPKSFKSVIEDRIKDINSQQALNIPDPINEDIKEPLEKKDSYETEIVLLKEKINNLDDADTYNSDANSNACMAADWESHSAFLFESKPTNHQLPTRPKASRDRKPKPPKDKLWGCIGSSIGALIETFLRNLLEILPRRLNGILLETSWSPDGDSH